jgi:hypothetical protein
MTEHPEQGGGSRAPEWSARVDIPADMDAAAVALGDLANLVSARHWEQAAVVYAFTREGEPGEGGPGRDQPDNSVGLPLAQFAALGIRGMNSHVTVRKYRRAWAAAMELGACEEARPGIAVDLPALDWDEMFKEGGGAHVANNAGDNEWNTPAAILAAARLVLGQIDLDPCSTELANAGDAEHEGVQAAHFYSTDDDGLAHDWHGTVFMNPPYAQPLVANFCAKLAEEYTLGHVTAAVVLVNNATDTDWFQDLAVLASGFCFPRARLKFWHASGKLSQPLQGQALLYFGDDHGKFTAEFSALGSQDKGWLVL